MCLSARLPASVNRQTAAKPHTPAATLKTTSPRVGPSLTVTAKPLRKINVAAAVTQLPHSIEHAHRSTPNPRIEQRDPVRAYGLFGRALPARNSSSNPLDAERRRAGLGGR